MNYRSGGTLTRAIGWTVLQGATSDFAYIRGSNFPTAEVVEEAITRFVSADHFGKDYEMGSNEHKFLERME